MDDTKWLHHVDKHKPHIIGQFENVHGERFVIYRNKSGDKAYITGDEFGWEIGVGLLWIDFLFSPQEREQVARIMWKTHSDLLTPAGP